MYLYQLDVILYQLDVIYYLLYPLDVLAKGSVDLKVIMPSKYIQM